MANKANVSVVKKIVGTILLHPAVRLSQPSSTIGIAEGIETALSAFAVRRSCLVLYLCQWNGEMDAADRHRTRACLVDNDLNGTGQAAVRNLAKRLMASGVAVEVKIPKQPGTDWADFLKEQT